MNEMVSCIICTYNRAELLRNAIESILAQTYPHWELLVVNDNSTDHTADVIKAYQEKDPRVRYLLNPRKGLPSARNCGIKAARGEFIAFLDDDDISLPHRFASQVEAMKKSGSAFLVSGYQVKNILTGEIVATHRLELKAAGAGVPSRWMVKKSLLNAIGGFDESFSCMEDAECSYRLAKYEVFALHDDIVLDYHIVPGSMSRNQRNNIIGRIRLLEKHHQVMPPLEAGWWHYMAGIEYYILGEKANAREQFRKAAEYDARGIYGLALWYFQLTSFLGGIFKKINLRVLSILEEYKLPVSVKHPIV